MQKARCQDCLGVWPVGALDPVRDIEQRVAAGEEMPAGECPKCGAVCHLIAEARYRVAKPSGSGKEHIQVLSGDDYNRTHCLCGCKLFGWVFGEEMSGDEMAALIAARPAPFAEWCKRTFASQRPAREAGSLR